MANKNLEILLTQYEEKRKRADIRYETKKEEIYNKFPRLEEIENELNKISINKAKNVLTKKQDIEWLEQRIKELKQEQSKILKKENISLMPKYECPICKDTGYIQKENSRTIMCNCLKQNLLNLAYNQSNLSDIKKDNFDNFNTDLFSDKGENSPRKNILQIKKASINFINNFNKLETKNLLFSGDTGTGKTFMSNCIANEMLKKGKTVLYQTTPVLLETIIDNKFNKYKTKNPNDFYKNVLDADLLIIDDLGVETLNSMKLSELFIILNTRILNLNNKPTKTIISTNLNIKEIFNLYEERIGSRIAGYYDIYQFFGNDLRLHK